MRTILIFLLLVLSLQGMGSDCSSGRNAGSDQSCSYYNNDPFRKPQYKTPLALPDSWPINILRNPMDRSPKTSKTRVVMLGTGMPSPNPYRSGPSHALVVDGFPYLIDAGEGVWRSISKAVLINGDKLNQAFSPRKLNVLFITHLHQDHTVGLPSLVLNPLNWIYGIRQDIFGPVGTKDMLKYINLAWLVDTDAAISDGFDPEDSRATAYDIDFEEDGIVYEDKRVKVEAFRTRHASLENTFAYRFTTSDRIVVFTGDGGPYNANIVRASRNADILVTETVTEDNIQYAPWGGRSIEDKKSTIFQFHFTPKILARIAKEAKVKTIVLSHEQNYNQDQEYDALGLVNEVRSAGFEGDIFSAMDGDIY